MSKQSHKIKRQIFELEAPRLELAKRAQADISRMYSARIAPVLDQACSEVSSADCIHRIDRVHVDLGVLGAIDFERELVEKLHSELQRALGEAIRAEEREATERGEDTRISSFLELFACFARTGSLPWWADATRPGILEENALTLMRDAPPALAELVRELAREPEALRRISMAYADAVLAELCEIVGEGQRGEGFAALPPAVAELHRAGKLEAGIPATRYRSIAWQCALKSAAQASRAETEGAAPIGQCKEALSEIAEAMNLTYGELLSIFEQGRDLPDVRLLVEEPPWSELFVRRGASEADGPNDLNRPRDAVNTPELAEPTGGHPRIAARATSRPAGRSRTPARGTKRPEPEFEPSFSDSDEIYTHDAGLVILWPFLRGFFRSVGLVADDQFKDAAAQHRAVAILNYLASGELGVVEYQLSLEKVLCGLDVTRTVEVHEPLSEAELAECGKFLESVIAQAPVVETMSIFDFRATFLQRLGQLTEQGGARLLRVEREAHDAALDRLPWSFDWAVLPWMRAPLRVQWR